MSRIQTKALVEGAIFSSITVIMGMIIFYIPVIALISIVWPVPTILIAFRHGLKVSINSVLVSSVLFAIMTQPIGGLGFFIGFGLPGIIMGYLLKKKLSAWNTIFLTGVVLAVCGVISTYLGMLVTGVDIFKAYDQLFIDFKNTFNETKNLMANTYNMMGVNNEEFSKRIAVFEKSFDLLKLILPVGLLISGIITSFINFKLTKLVLQRINYFLEDVTPFSLWNLPHKWMAFVMLTLFCSVVEMTLIRLPQLYALAMNIFTIATALFMILGLSVTKFFLDKYAVPKVFKVIIIYLMVFVLGNITMLIGVIDMLLDLRKLRDKPIGNV